MSFTYIVQFFALTSPLLFCCLKSFQVIAILDRLKDEKKIVGNPDDQRQSSDLTEDNSDWDVDDPDEEGIIYVK